MYKDKKNNNYNKLKSILFLVTFILSSFVSATAHAGHIQLTKKATELPLSSAIILFEDKTGTPSAPQALNYFKQQRHATISPDTAYANKDKSLLLNKGHKTYWLQFKVTNKTNKEDWVLSLGELFHGMSFIVDHLSVYEGDNHIPVAVISKESTEENRTLVDGTGISLTLPPNITRTITFRIDTPAYTNVTIAPKIVERGVYSKHLSQKKLIMAGVVVIIIALIATTLSMLILSRLPSLLFFGIYAPLLILYITAHEGALHWLSPFLPLILHEPVYLVTTFASIFCSTMIIRYYLELRTRSELLDNIIIGIAALLPLIPASIISDKIPQEIVEQIQLYVPVVIALLGALLGLFFAFTASLPHSFWLSYIALLGAYSSLVISNNMVSNQPPYIATLFFVLMGVHIILLGLALIGKLRLVLRQRYDLENSIKQRAIRQQQEEKQQQKIIQQFENKVKEQEKEYLQELRKQDAARKAELLEAKREAERANEAKSDFLAMISHEIRTPLTGILGMVELTSQTSLNSQQREYIDTVQYSGETLLALLNDILDFSKIEKGKLELEIINFNIAKLAKSVLMLMSGRAGEKGLELKLDIKENVPAFVQGDPTRIRQILLNLVNNAIKFTDTGSVTLTVEKENDNGKFVTIRYSVTDTGIGLSEQAKSRLFSAYSQADESISRKYGGTGLGLSICKKLISAMSGKIDVDSVEGQGSTFWFSIPMELGVEQYHKEKQNNIGDMLGKSLKIFCIDDNEINTKVLAGLLSKQGHIVKTETSPANAMKIIRNENFDVILTDMQMPQMSGPEIAQAIRTLDDQEKAKTPIIALTGNAGQEDMAICQDAGMNDFLIKPISVESLNRVLNAVMHGEGRFDIRDIPHLPQEPKPTQHKQPVDNGSPSESHNIVKEKSTMEDTLPPLPTLPDSSIETSTSEKPKTIATTQPNPIKPMDNTPSLPVLDSAPSEPQVEEKSTPSVEQEITPPSLPVLEIEPEPEQLPIEEKTVPETTPELESATAAEPPAPNPEPSQQNEKVAKIVKVVEPEKEMTIKDRINKQIAFLDMGTIDDIIANTVKNIKESSQKAKKSAQALIAQYTQKNTVPQIEAPAPTSPSQTSEKTSEPVQEPSPASTSNSETITSNIEHSQPSTPVDIEEHVAPTPEVVPEQEAEPTVVQEEPIVEPTPETVPQESMPTTTEEKPPFPLNSPKSEPVSEELQEEQLPPPLSQTVPEEDLYAQAAPVAVDIEDPVIPTVSEPEVTAEPATEPTPVTVQEPILDKVPEQEVDLPPLDIFTAPTKLIDEKAVKDLYTSLGRDTFEELYSELWEKADSLLDILNKASTEGNMKTVNERGHEIKGMCANYGLIGISSIARDIEEYGMREDNRMVQATLPHIPQLLTETRQIIQDFLDGKIVLGGIADEEEDNSDYLI